MTDWVHCGSKRRNMSEILFQPSFSEAMAQDDDCPVCILAFLMSQHPPFYSDSEASPCPLSHVLNSLYSYNTWKVLRDFLKPNSRMPSFSFSTSYSLYIKKKQKTVDTNTDLISALSIRKWWTEWTKDNLLTFLLLSMNISQSHCSMPRRTGFGNTVGCFLCRSWNWLKASVKLTCWIMLKFTIYLK